MMGGENRRKSIIKALRKRRIDHAVSYPFYYRGAEKAYDIGFYKNLHQYSKNKIHCSCPMCSAKTNGGNYKISDLRKIQRLEYQDE